MNYVCPRSIIVCTPEYIPDLHCYDWFQRRFLLVLEGVAVLFVNVANILAVLMQVWVNVWVLIEGHSCQSATGIILYFPSTK